MEEVASCNPLKSVASARISPAHQDCIVNALWLRGKVGQCCNFAPFSFDLSCRKMSQVNHSFVLGLASSHRLGPEVPEATISSGKAPHTPIESPLL